VIVEVRQHSSSNVTVLTIHGRIDTYNVHLLQQQLEHVLLSKSSALVIDLGGVDFMDSSGLAVLVQSMKKCRERGGDLRLSNPQRAVRMILELTRLDRAVEIFPCEADAIASFSLRHSV